MVELAFLKIGEKVELLKYAKFLEVDILYTLCVSIIQMYSTKSDIDTRIRNL